MTMFISLSPVKYSYCYSNRNGQDKSYAKGLGGKAIAVAYGKVLAEIETEA